MSSNPDPAEDLRGLSKEELARVGEDSLQGRLIEQATYAHQKYAPLTADKLDALLLDPECVRYPTRLVYEIGGMAGHQFAQPEMDPRAPEAYGRVLYLRPVLQQRPDLVVLAVAYMLPVVNYGDIIRDDHCLSYGATFLGLMQEEFYRQICALAEFVGSEVAYTRPLP